MRFHNAFALLSKNLNCRSVGQEHLYIGPPDTTTPTLHAYSSKQARTKMQETTGNDSKQGSVSVHSVSFIVADL